MDLAVVPHLAGVLDLLSLEVKAGHGPGLRQTEQGRKVVTNLMRMLMLLAPLMMIVMMSKEAVITGTAEIHQKNHSKVKTSVVNIIINTIIINIIIT